MSTTAPATTAQSPTSTSPTTSLPALPRLNTSPQPGRGASNSPMSQSTEASSSQETTGSAETACGRPSSRAFPMFPSSLPYALVRDFAYNVTDPLHYGPPPAPSRPASDASASWGESYEDSSSWEQRMPWDSWTADGFNRGHDIPPIHFGDGPPYSEDEDLQSPIVATRHRKHRSTSNALSPGRGRTAVRDGPGVRSSIMDPANFDHERGYYVDTARDGTQRYYVNHSGEANGPGGEYVSYPPDQARRSRAYHFPQQFDDQTELTGHSDSPSSPAYPGGDESRYSRDYQFTITSPDEEFHGKAVALFDFERENENELPLVEGQIIWVSYRHGQGWLVAEDPKTEESGLVPEAYVRLLREIEGGMNSLTGQAGEGSGSPNDAGTPTQADSSHFGQGPATAPSNASNGYHQPVVSMFSTSSKDLNPYPTQGLQSGQVPPQVVHYHGQRGGSQASTPTLAQPEGAGLPTREDDETVDDREKVKSSPVSEQLEAQSEVSKDTGAS